MLCRYPQTEASKLKPFSAGTTQKTDGKKKRGSIANKEETMQHQNKRPKGTRMRYSVPKSLSLP